MFRIRSRHSESEPEPHTPSEQVEVIELIEAEPAE